MNKTRIYGIFTLLSLLSPLAKPSDSKNMSSWRRCIVYMRASHLNCIELSDGSLLWLCYFVEGLCLVEWASTFCSGVYEYKRPPGHVELTLRHYRWCDSLQRKKREICKCIQAMMNRNECFCVECRIRRTHPNRSVDIEVLERKATQIIQYYIHQIKHASCTWILFGCAILNVWTIQTVPSRITP